MTTAAEIMAGSKAYQDHERRDGIYKTATFLVETFWGQASKMADSLGVLLLTWNAPFYRFGYPDFDALEQCIARNQAVLDDFRGRRILSYEPADDAVITALYDQFHEALRIAEGEGHAKRCDVSVAKALHLLAPGFFPLWDDKIARAYNCRYQYLPFMREIRRLADLLGLEVDLRSTEETFLKLVDEYNYAKYTKRWV